jgi:hypothetical protein
MAQCTYPYNKIIKQAQKLISFHNSSIIKSVILVSGGKRHVSFARNRLESPGGLLNTMSQDFAEHSKKECISLFSSSP